ncbi:MAG TPA: hypothetical protein VFD92_14095 [Candidatus Binatia bacterium]|nr:hypothetical protein [Candidatus Binatia bacterium]
MLDARLFTPLPREERRRIADDYVAFALARDGDPDVRERRLSRREEFFRKLAERPAPEWRGERIDREKFARLHRGTIPPSEVSPLTFWLVQVARANEGEGWGVDYLLDRGGFDGLGEGGRNLQPRDFADLEETYHTRIMHEVCRLFGIEFQMRTPPRVIQQSVKIMAHLPRRASYMLLLAGELMGTVAFASMAQKGERLLADHPEMRERVRELFDEILVDEVGHVTFLLGSMNGWQLAVIRRLALAYSGASRRGYDDAPPADVALMQKGIRDYSLTLMPERVVRRAFVPEQYWPDAYGPYPGAWWAAGGDPPARTALA